MEITSSTMVKLAYSTPHPLVSEKVPLTVFDRAALDIFVPIVLTYPAPAPPNKAPREGLLKAVAPYPGGAPRPRRRRPALPPRQQRGRAPDRGHRPGRPGGRARRWPHGRWRRGPLPYVTRGKHQGGAAADPAEQGKDFTTPTPFPDRARTAVPRITPTPVFDHRSLYFTCGDGDAYAVVPMDRIKNLTLHFTAEFVADLKSCVGARCSTFQCLLMHVWKKLTAARDLKPEEFTKVRVAVNCRGRADPPVPMDFFGNMVLWAFPRLQVQDILNSSYGSVVGVIWDAVTRIDDEYVQSFVDFDGVADAKGEELVATAAAAGTMFCPDAEVDSWLGFRFHQLDFDTGAPSAFVPPDLPFTVLPCTRERNLPGSSIYIVSVVYILHIFTIVVLSSFLENHGNYGVLRSLLPYY
ncbi:unnamed protein product [Triticum turgidum subsp. durum]|uniref:Uncharacterized protein n=1 Tax=Triticum turgidum subsp. durum TaxID=4567 RepID=A0A9R1QGB4_TRITD|nr:unnamed protein product [Triticum turgidum subsp. durum]